jgi:hypothetical protein
VTIVPTDRHHGVANLDEVLLLKFENLVTGGFSFFFGIVGNDDRSAIVNS